MSDDLVAFLEARLDEDEAVARAAERVHPNVSTSGQWEPGDDGVRHAEWGQVFEGAGYGSTHLEDELAIHIARHDPARVLREVTAKRRLLAEHAPRMVMVMSGDGKGFPGLHCGRCSPSDPNARQRHPCTTVRLLAMPYADHVDFRPEWSPTDE